MRWGFCALDMPYKDKEKRLALVRDWRKRNSSYDKEWRKKNPDIVKKFLVKDKEKSRARSTLRRSVWLGKIDKLPCSICGELKVEAHHQDYTKPLEVIWFCRIHHEKHHHPSK